MKEHNTSRIPLKALLFLLIICVLVRCSENKKEEHFLNRFLNDNQILTNKDFKKKLINLEYFNAELKFGEIIKTGSSELFQNRFALTLDYYTMGQKIYLNEGEVITRILHDKKRYKYPTFVKQLIQNNKKYEFMIAVNPETRQQHIFLNVFESVHDSLVKVMNYRIKSDKFLVYPTDPTRKIHIGRFKEENYELVNKQEIILNSNKHPKEIIWYNSDFTQTFEYDKDGNLISNKFLDYIETYEYENGLMVRSMKKSGRDINGTDEEIFSISKKNFEYEPSDENWTKRIETNEWRNHETPVKIITSYHILEKN